jgi:hypothetical protein
LAVYMHLQLKTTRKLTPQELASLPRNTIDKRKVLSIFTKEGKRVTGAAKYTDGVVTLRISIPVARTVPIT